MSKNLEGVHVRFLIQVTGKTYKRHRDGTWRSASVESVIKDAVKIPEDHHAIIAMIA